MTPLKVQNWVTFKFLRLSAAAMCHIRLPHVFVPLQPPSEEKINGILLGSRIRYRELLYDRLRTYSVHTISSVSAWAELTGEASSP